MKKLALMAVAATSLATAFTGSSNAAPLPNGPEGAKCAFNSSTDVTREAGNQIGHWRAGPLVTGEAGTLHCTLLKNANTHDAASTSIVAHRQGDAVNGVVVLAPEVLTYAATAADDISLCTKWVGASGTLYWESGNTAAAQLGGWRTSPTSTCGVATSIEPNDPECSIWLAIDQRAGTDIAGTWQDCEPYDPII
jgi:hypothetical protein